MKYKLKIIPKLLVFITFLTLTNCSNEFENQIKNSTNKNNISFEQFKKETGLKDFKTKISINLNHDTSTARTADGSYELSDFIIDTDVIKSLTYDEKTTYTFKIDPVIIINTDIYNLTISNKEGYWVTTIVALKPTEENFQMIQSGLTDKFEGSIQKLYQSGLITFDNEFICQPLIIIDLHCIGGGECHDGFCDGCRDCLTVETYDFCSGDEEGNTGGGYVGPSDSGSGGGPTGTDIPISPPTTPNNEEPIPIIPNLEGLNLNLDPDDPVNPCLQLNALKNKSSFVSKMTVLKNNIGGTHEKGFMIKESSNNEFSPIIDGNQYGDVVYPFETMPIDDLYRTYGTAHNHLENNPLHIGIFTPEDFQILLTNGLVETAAINPYRSDTPIKAIAYLITNKGLFAIKINDLAKLGAYVAKCDNMPFPDFLEYYKNIYTNPEKYNINPSSTREQLVKGLLQLIQDENAGVDLFEGNKDTFGDWKKLTLVANGSQGYDVISQPCN